jgi:hypothetical protein
VKAIFSPGVRNRVSKNHLVKTIAVMAYKNSNTVVRKSFSFRSKTITKHRK